MLLALSTETEYQPVPRDSKNPHRYERLSYERPHKYSDFLVWIIEFLPRKSIERIHSAGALYHRYGVSRLPCKSHVRKQQFCWPNCRHDTPPIHTGLFCRLFCSSPLGRYTTKNNTRKAGIRFPLFSLKNLLLSAIAIFRLLPPSCRIPPESRRRCCRSRAIPYRPESDGRRSRSPSASPTDRPCPEWRPR